MATKVSGLTGTRPHLSHLSFLATLFASDESKSTMQVRFKPPLQFCKSSSRLEARPAAPLFRTRSVSLTNQHVRTPLKVAIHTVPESAAPHPLCPYRRPSRRPPRLLAASCFATSLGLATSQGNPAHQHPTMPIQRMSSSTYPFQLQIGCFVKPAGHPGRTANPRKPCERRASRFL